MGVKGSEFWKLRSKHGRDKLFKSPELLWNAACEYFKWCDENPILRNDFKGKDIQEVHYKLTRAYTITGLCLYLGCSENYLRHFEKNNKDSDDFMPIITRIRETIYTQKLEGAAAGIFNANIIARDLGLVDKKQTEKTKTDQSPEAIDKRLKELGLQ